MTYSAEAVSTADDDHGHTWAAIRDSVGCCVESVSQGFGRWDDPHARGPGLYFVVEQGSLGRFTTPMGANGWPVEDCPSVFGDADALQEAARGVAFACDGAVVVHEDGTVEEQMVRLTQPSPEKWASIGDLPYAAWMGARHMSALETSTREAVSGVVTLSEEDGRMTVFRDGTFTDCPRDAFGTDWRPFD